MARLSVNITEETAGKIRRYKDRKSLSSTDALRRAVALLDLVERELAEGGEVLIRSHGDVVRQVWVL